MSVRIPPQQQVDMIRHDDESQDVKAVLLSGRFQFLTEDKSASRIMEVRLAAEGVRRKKVNAEVVFGQMGVHGNLPYLI